LQRPKLAKTIVPETLSIERSLSLLFNPAHERSFCALKYNVYPHSGAMVVAGANHEALAM
jgi:hypothetical protein